MVGCVLVGFGFVLVGLKSSGGIELCGESQQSAAGFLEDLGVWA